MQNFRKIALTTTILATLVSGSAVARESTWLPRGNWYGSLSGNSTWMDNSDLGGGGNIGLGYRIDNVRLEGEAGYHTADGKGGYPDTNYISYMGNVYYDFNTMNFARWKFVPYIGGGVGNAAVRYGNSSLSGTWDHHDNQFAYQGMAGVSFTAPAISNADLFVGYRYFATDGDLESNNAEVGVRFYF
jgi:hypothetical protein